MCKCMTVFMHESMMVGVYEKQADHEVDEVIDKADYNEVDEVIDKESNDKRESE